MLLSQILVLTYNTISINYCLIYGFYGCNPSGHKLKVCATKERHYHLDIALFYCDNTMILNFYFSSCVILDDFRIEFVFFNLNAMM